MSRKPLERDVTRHCVSTLEELGYLPIRLHLANKAGIPDYMFLGRKGEVFFIEFKRPGEDESSLQRFWRIEILQERGFLVWVVEDPDQFEDVIADILEAYPL